MIKNIIFDFGQVLVKFIPYDMTKVYISDENDIKLVAEVVFDRTYWDKLDAGTITDEEVIEECKKRLPERLWHSAEKVYYNWIYNIPEIEGMAEVVENLKKEGKNLCILSNIATLFVEHHQENQMIKRFDKLVFSSACGMTKPNQDIFEYVLKKYDFKASETLFVDDRADNISGAESVGIMGYLFDGNVQKFKEFLKKIK